MKRKRFTEERIAFALGQTDSGTTTAEVCRKMQIVMQQTDSIWRDPVVLSFDFDSLVREADLGNNVFAGVLRLVWTSKDGRYYAAESLPLAVWNPVSPTVRESFNTQFKEARRKIAAQEFEDARARLLQREQLELPMERVRIRRMLKMFGPAIAARDSRRAVSDENG